MQQLVAIYLKVGYQDIILAVSCHLHIQVWELTVSPTLVWKKSILTVYATICVNVIYECIHSLQLTIAKLASTLALPLVA